MSESPLISVIVPVYKVEAYLDRCVQSIVDQTYTNLEIILVDDGSPDSCPQMCDEWAKKDKRIRVIHKENGGGGGAARNVGIQAATGSLIGFVDSDDYISRDFYEHLYSMMDADVDIAECGYLLVETEVACFDDAREHGIYKRCNRYEAFEYHLYDQYFRQLVWNKLYRTSVVSGVFFPVGKKIDDEFWTYKVIANSKKLIHSEARLYAYRQQLGSVTHQLYSTDRLQTVEARYERALFVKQILPELMSIAKRGLWFGCLYQGQMVLRSGNAEQIRNIFAVLKKYYEDCEIRWKDLEGLSVTHKIWILMGKISLRMTCTVRNMLKIGL